MTSLRTIAGLIALSALLAGCGPSEKERELAARAIAAEAKAEAEKAKLAKLAASPAAAPSAAPDAAEDDSEDFAEDEEDLTFGEPMDDTGGFVHNETPPGGGPALPAAVPQVPFAEPPAMIDVPQPEYNPYQPDDGVEYVTVRS